MNILGIIVIIMTNLVIVADMVVVVVAMPKKHMAYTYGINSIAAHYEQANARCCAHSHDIPSTTFS